MLHLGNYLHVDYSDCTWAESSNVCRTLNSYTGTASNNRRSHLYTKSFDRVCHAAKGSSINTLQDIGEVSFGCDD